MCEHIPKLEFHYPCPGRCEYCGEEVKEPGPCRLHIYPGRYCIYCQQEVVRIESEHGQLVLKELPNERVRKYVAVIHKGQQKPVVEFTELPDSQRSRIKFVGDDRGVEFDTRKLIMDLFQDSEEVFRAEEA